MSKSIRIKSFLVFLAVSFILLPLGSKVSGEAGEEGAKGSFNQKDFSHLLGMEGFSDDMLSDHFDLYGGYVRSSNKVRAKLMKLLDSSKQDTPEYAEIKRRLGWELNGVKLHEYYFGNLGGDGELDTSSALYEALTDQFGSFELWKKDFIATGAMRGIGWVVLYQDPDTGMLVNSWIEQHDKGHPSGSVALLVMDVFEHAYMTDYRLDRASYIEAFFDNIDWLEVERRMVI